MKRAKRLISLLLVLAMLAAYMPAVYADEEPDETAQEQLSEEEPEIEIEPEETEVPEDVPVDVPEEAPEDVPEDVPVDVPEEAPVLSADELDWKALLAENDVPGTLAQLTEGVDYVAGEVILMTESEEYALAVAEAYHGILLSCEAGVAKIGLTDMTVLEAVTLAADPDSGLPAVSPNYCSSMQTQFTSEPPAFPSDADIEAEDLYAPMHLDWYTLVRELFDNPDPMLKDPASTLYQWHHDVMHTYGAWNIVTGMVNPMNMKIAVISDGVSNADGELVSLNTERGNNLLKLGVTSGYRDGTFAAHLIAAQMNNGIMGAGVVPDVHLISYNVTDSTGTYNTDNISKAINDAISYGVKIIYIDRVFHWYNTVYDTAIRKAINNGVTVIAPVGNDGTNAKTWPAAFAGVIGVSGVTRAGTRSTVSNYGTYADVSAPGDMILTSYDGSSWWWKGASPAAALVTGAAAMYMCKMGTVSPAAMEKALKAGTVKAAESGLGSGILDLEKLLSSGGTAPRIQIVTAGNSPVVTASVEDPAEEAADADVFGGSGIVGGPEDTVPTAPVGGTPAPSVPKIPAHKVSSEYYLMIDQPKAPGDLIIYTTDGTNPAVLNGKVVNGDKFTGRISLKTYGRGEVIIKAISISGTGAVSKQAVIKLDILAESAPTSVTVIAPKNIIAGKSVTLTANVLPETAKQGVVWTIVSRSGCYSAKIDRKTGKLTTSASETGSVTVRAAAEANTARYKDSVITIKRGNPVSSIVLNYPSLNILAYSDSSQNSTRQLVPTFLDSSKYPISGVSCTYVSSNPKVAAVDASGMVTAVSAGTATITCKALDGSGKSAACKVTVRNGPDALRFIAQSSIAPGSSATYGIETFPKGSKNLVTRWSLVDAPFGVTINAKTGKVTVASYISVGTSFFVAVEAEDGQYIYTGKYEVSVNNKTQSLGISYDSGYTKPLSASFDKKGSLKSITLFSTAALESKLSSGTYIDTNEVRLVSVFSGYGTNTFSDRQKWSSSNTKVAVVDTYTGVVTALKSGTAKITCKANDGSGKSASVTVKVVTPVSSVTVVGPTDIKTVNYGKSVANKAVLGDAYGKPSSTAVTWSIASVTEEVFDTSGNSVRSYNRTQDAVNTGYITVSSSGKLSVKTNAQNLLYNNYGSYRSYLKVTVRATANDGSQNSGELAYAVRNPLYAIGLPFSGTYTIRSGYTGRMMLELAGPNSCTEEFIVKSSNPEVVGGSIGTYNGKPCLYIYPGGKLGTAKLTVTSADQAKKSVKLTVKVTP